MGQARHLALTEKMTSYRTSLSKPEGKRQLARPRRMWDENIGMDLRGIA
jgi:hypothetical protein